MEKRKTTAIPIVHKWHGAIHKVTYKHRIFAALTLGGSFGLMWIITHHEIFYKVFEFTLAPFADKLLFEAKAIVADDEEVVRAATKVAEEVVKDL